MGESVTRLTEDLCGEVVVVSADSRGWRIDGGAMVGLMVSEGRTGSGPSNESVGRRGFGGGAEALDGVSAAVLVAVVVVLVVAKVAGLALFLAKFSGGSEGSEGIGGADDISVTLESKSTVNMDMRATSGNSGLPDWRPLIVSVPLDAGFDEDDDETGIVRDESSVGAADDWARGLGAEVNDDECGVGPGRVAVAEESGDGERSEGRCECRTMAGETLRLRLCGMVPAGAAMMGIAGCGMGSGSGGDDDGEEVEVMAMVACAGDGEGTGLGRAEEAGLCFAEGREVRPENCGCGCGCDCDWDCDCDGCCGCGCGCGGGCC